ncbi:MAG: DNA-processing protein DprA [Elainella sp.]
MVDSRVDSGPNFGPDSHFNLQQLMPNAENYPAVLKARTDGKSPPVLTALGNLSLLQRPALALLCSHTCPGEWATQARDLVPRLQNLDFVLISGFHTGVEQDWLHLLLNSTASVIHCPARSLHAFHLSPQQTQALQAQRLLMLSPFPTSARRATVQLAARRNALVTALATAALVAYAAPDGRTAALAQQLIQLGKPVFTLKGNQRLLEMGAREVGKMGEVGR